THQVLFSVTHMNVFYEDALQHVIADMFTSFNFIHSLRRLNLISDLLISHLFTVLDQRVNRQMLYENLTLYIASAILMNVYSSLMHSMFLKFY
ncbi:hypothetical protein EMCG_04560, partial [[Emmonsia] crescens]